MNSTAVSFEEPEHTPNSDAVGALRVLESIRIARSGEEKLLSVIT